jgi:hypothetical protein
MKGSVQKLQRSIDKLQDENAALRKLLEDAGIAKVVAFPSRGK